MAGSDPIRPNRLRLVRWTAVAVVVTLSPAGSLRAQVASRVAAPSSAGMDSARAGEWTLTVDGALAHPTGWVQVRENAIVGTRLSLGPDLGVRAASTVRATLGIPVGAGALRVAIAGTALLGRVLLPDSIHFNGSTLAPGTMLKTRTEPGDFLRVVIAYERRLARVGQEGALDVSAGLDATLLNFRLQGTLAPASVGHETKEDFVTQELPAPFLGAELRLPLARRLGLDFAADGGGLPWVSSFRYEGGLVSLTQRRLDGQADIDVALASHLRAGVGVQYTDFRQNEQSHEDGNQFEQSSLGGVLRMRWAF